MSEQPLVRRTGHRGTGSYIEVVDVGGWATWWWVAWRRWLRAEGLARSETDALEAVEHFIGHAWP